MAAEGRSTVEVLRAARERISDPERWTKKAFARNADQRAVSVHRETAVCWCALGSLYVEDETSQAETLLASACGEIDIGEFNDTHSHSEVLAAFDQAIEKAEAI